MGWLHAKKSKVKESTYIKYSTVVEKHIIPKLGDCCPLGFTTELMDDFIREELRDKIAELERRNLDLQMENDLLKKVRELERRGRYL